MPGGPLVYLHTILARHLNPLQWFWFIVMGVVSRHCEDSSGAASGVRHGAFISISRYRGNRCNRNRALYMGISGNIGKGNNGAMTMPARAAWWWLLETWVVEDIGGYWVNLQTELLPLSCMLIILLQQSKGKQSCKEIGIGFEYVRGKISKISIQMFKATNHVST